MPRDDKAQASLNAGASRGNVEWLADALARGASPNERWSGATERPLVVAVRRHHTAAAEFLVKNGADVDGQAEDANRPLACAAAVRLSVVVNRCLPISFLFCSCFGRLFVFFLKKKNL